MGRFREEYRRQQDQEQTRRDATTDEIQKKFKKNTGESLEEEKKEIPPVTRYNKFVPKPANTEQENSSQTKKI